VSAGRIQAKTALCSFSPQIICDAHPVHARAAGDGEQVKELSIHLATVGPLLLWTQLAKSANNSSRNWPAAENKPQSIATLKHPRQLEDCCWPMATALQFQVEVIRREINACDSLPAIREAALKTLALLESQRAVFDQMAQQGWLNR
jgi:hypothetical protein